MTKIALQIKIYGMQLAMMIVHCAVIYHGSIYATLSGHFFCLVGTVP